MSNELLDLYNQVSSAIAEIDEKLDSQEDAGTVGKRKLTNELIAASENAWKPISDNLISQLKEADADVQVGVFYGLIRELQKEFSSSVAEIVEGMVSANPVAEAEKISDEELEALSKARSDLYQKVKSLIEMAKNFGMDSGMEMPKKRTGKRGKRGPRAISFYSWDVDGTAFEKLKDVAEHYSNTYEKAKDLTAAMRAAGINLTKPETDRITFTLPDGKILVGIKGDTPVEDSDDNDGIEEEEEETPSE